MKRFLDIWGKLNRSRETVRRSQSPVESNSPTLASWIKRQIEAEGYWFHSIELPGGIVTPGWNNPKTEKLPFFGLPREMDGLRVLDIGHAEGFFSFEAERRGAAEVVGIETYPAMIRKFNICRAAFGSSAQSFRASVYDLNPKTFGTFDLVFFFGVLYHLRHPLLALEKIHSVCTGTLLMQTAISGDSSEVPRADFHPFGVQSGPADNQCHDPTCFWFPNVPCCIAMLSHAGFQQIVRLSPEAPVGAVFSAQAALQSPARRPDEAKAPWS